MEATKNRAAKCTISMREDMEITMPGAVKILETA
jgi:hypothetical protein